MSFQDFVSELDREVDFQTRAKIRRLVRRGTIHRQDVGDVEHSLVVRVLQALPAFDPSRGTMGQFLAVVLDRALCNILREHRTRRRYLSTSLDRSFRDAVGGAWIGDGVDESSLRRHRGVHQRPDFEVADLSEDVRTLLAKLPHKLRVAAEAIFEAGTLSAAARKLGIPRTTLTYRRDVIRGWFRRARLSDYL